ncbi:MAG: hypothetical protein JWN73_4714 [Betaproteobacteria bacterium]|nr:hypothetical protein [Betaproteobacteria bacterium]
MRFTRSLAAGLAAVAALGVGWATLVFAQVLVPYGAPISLDQAKKAVAAATAEARKNNLGMAVAVVDTGGALVSFERMDNTQTGSIKVAIQKAQSAAAFRRATKVFEDTLASGGGLRILALPGAVPIEGGVPIVVEGRIVGAIGASGGTAQQDGLIATAGLAAVR